jgi:ABC-type transport system involved in multi-copper enzyme maturation permease subunit
MRQFIAIAINTFMELVRQPVFLLLLTASTGFSVFLAAVPYFGFGDDPKLVKDGTLAVMLLAGLFGAVLSASASVARELRQGTALAVLSKPVGRARFLLAKYCGLAAALTFLTYANLLSALIASRMAYDAYGSTDTRSLAIFFGALVLGYGVAGFSNFFLRRPFVADAVFAVVTTITLAFVIIVWFTPKNPGFLEFFEVDWRLLPAAVLILFALWILAGLALACATRWDMIPTLAVCSGVFLLGLMSDYLFGQRAEPAWRSANLAEAARDPAWSDAQRQWFETVRERYDTDEDGRLSQAEADAMSAEDRRGLRQAGLSGAWWAKVLYGVIPNWQLFWMADVLEGKAGTQIALPDGTSRPNAIPWSYVGKALGYVAGYLGASLVVGLLLFEERELS